MDDGLFGKMFFLAALWNFGAAALGLFFTKFQFELLFGEDAYTGDYHQIYVYRMFWVAVALFGIGYLIVAWVTTENRAIVWLGILGKLLMFAFILHAFLRDEATGVLLAIGVGEFLWTLLFFWFLHETRDRVRVGNLIG